MKLTKIAGLDIPKGFYKIVVKTDKKGGFKAEIVRGNGGTKCSDSAERILDALGLGDVDESGRTNEFYDQNRPRPMPVKVPEQEETIPLQQPPERERMGLGYGT